MPDQITPTVKNYFEKNFISINFAEENPS